VLSKKAQEKGKLRYVEKLGHEKTVSIGNGRNDRLMLKKAPSIPSGLSQP